MQYVKADSTGILKDLNDVGYMTPAGSSCYDKEEMGALSAYKKNCDLCQMNLKSTQETLVSFQKKNAGQLLWWQTPVGVISIGVGGLALGLLLK